MSMLIVKEESQFEKSVLQAEGKVLVDFYADWCGPCKMVAPILEDISAKEGKTIVKVNVDEQQTLAQRYQVMSIPTLILFENGQEQKKVVGAQSREALMNLFG